MILKSSVGEWFTLTEFAHPACFVEDFLKLDENAPVIRSRGRLVAWDPVRNRRVASDVSDAAPRAGAHESATLFGVARVLLAPGLYQRDPRPLE